jgi:hypothetical protein
VRETKWRRRSTRWAGQIRPPVQRTSTSPSSRTASESHWGQRVGKTVGRALLVRRQVLEHLRDDVAGALDADAVADPDSEAFDLVLL